MKNSRYTVQTSKGFDETVSAVQQKAVEKGFRVLHTHDVAATLAEKGFRREPLKIVEVCNARHANEALNREIDVALMLPCPISVYTLNGKTFISTMRPSALADFYPQAHLEDIASAVETAVLAMLNEAR